jgi:hypothetical protein
MIKFIINGVYTGAIFASLFLLAVFIFMPYYLNMFIFVMIFVFLPLLIISALSGATLGLVSGIIFFISKSISKKNSLVIFTILNSLFITVSYSVYFYIIHLNQELVESFIIQGAVLAAVLYALISSYFVAKKILVKLEKRNLILLEENQKSQ